MLTTDFGEQSLAVLWLPFGFKKLGRSTCGTKFSPTPLCSQPKFCEEGFHPFTSTKRIASIRFSFGFFGLPPSRRNDGGGSDESPLWKKSDSSVIHRHPFSFSVCIMSVIPVLHFLFFNTTVIWRRMAMRCIETERMFHTCIHIYVATYMYTSVCFFPFVVFTGYTCCRVWSTRCDILNSLCG